MDSEELNRDRGWAVQFAPFDALSGYGAMIEGLKKQKTEKRILSDEAAETLSARLSALSEKETVRLKYYDKAEQRYKTVLGELREVDLVFRRLKIGKNYIAFDDIEAIKKISD